MTMQNRVSSKPVFDLEREAVKTEITDGILTGIAAITGEEKHNAEQDSFHNTKLLLKQFRRVAYAVKISETELNLRMEMEHGTKLSTLELNAELAGVDLTGTKLERYTQSVVRSKTMLGIICNALEAVRMDPDRGELLYSVLNYTYFIEPKPRNRDSIIAKLDMDGYPMSAASYHNYLNAAINAIDRILWGYTARDCMEIIKSFVPEN